MVLRSSNPKPDYVSARLLVLKTEFEWTASWCLHIRHFHIWSNFFWMPTLSYQWNSWYLKAKSKFFIHGLHLCSLHRAGMNYSLSSSHNSFHCCPYFDYLLSMLQPWRYQTGYTPVQFSVSYIMSRYPLHLPRRVPRSCSDFSGLIWITEWDFRLHYVLQFFSLPNYLSYSSSRRYCRSNRFARTVSFINPNGCWSVCFVVTKP